MSDDVIRTLGALRCFYHRWVTREREKQKLPRFFSQPSLVTYLFVLDTGLVLFSIFSPTRQPTIRDGVFASNTLTNIIKDSKLNKSNQNHLFC